MPVPTISNLVPNSGDVIGGEEVTINGNNFTGTTAVAFGSVAAESFTVVSNTVITAVAPEVPGLVTGVVDVRITNAAGTSATSGADHFTYSAPTTSDLLNAIEALGVQEASNASALAGLTANVDALVTSVAAVQGTVDQLIPPTVTGLSQTSGPASGGFNVQITGTGFTNAIAVMFGTYSATSFSIQSDTLIYAIAPDVRGSDSEGATFDVRVIASSPPSAISPADQFYFWVIPQVTAVTPNTGPPGQSVVITGTGFAGTTGVVVVSPPGNANQAAATSVVVDSDTQVTAVMPLAAAWASGLPSGYVDVHVVTSYYGGSPVSAADQFTYE